MRTANTALLEDALNKATREVDAQHEAYEQAVSWLASNAYRAKRQEVADLIFERIKRFDTSKHQPPSVEPYRLIWECQHEVEDLDEPHRTVEDYEAAQRRMAELSQQLAQAKGD